MNTSIRAARPPDLDILTGLLAELFAIETDFQVDPVRQRAGLELLLAAPSALVLVAERGGRVVGMCTLQMLVSTAEGGPAALLEDLIVHRPCRSQGIGRALLSAAEQGARERGARRIQLLADRRNRHALAFYAAAGWTVSRMIAVRKLLD